MELNHIRHSLAHILALAVKRLYKNVKFGVGPVTEHGFFYDFEFKEPPSEKELEKIEKEMRKIIKEGLPFEGKEVDGKEAKKILKGQPYKHELVDDLEKYGTTEFQEIKKTKESRVKSQKSKVTITLYTIGEFIDLCRGGHVKKTNDINADAFTLTHMSGAYWRGDEKNPQMTRIYGVAFKTKKELGEHLAMVEEAKRRDHRVLGRELELFAFHDISPGAPFWYPKGMIIFRELEKLIREETDKRGYQEISTPVLVKKDLWEQSGHWEHYQENMFLLEVDNEIYSLKPMNCPESTYVYNSKIRSYRDLPLRLSEIGRLHRNEVRGALGGLLRVRQITMDDAHIFCRPDQIEEEIVALIKFIAEFYEIFGLEPRYHFATKPEKAMGAGKLWKQAEKALENALKKNKIKYELKPGDGAFYGPKIDVQISDAIGRDWQLATIQLDFQMPERFNLTYTDERGKKQRPAMIHRAIFGSFERFIGVLIEHFAGEFPTWLAPVQAIILPIGEKQRKYGEQVEQELIEAGIRTELDTSDETLNKRIRNAELQKIPYILVVGAKEEKDKAVNARSRKGKKEEFIALNKFITAISKEITDRTL